MFGKAVLAVVTGVCMASSVAMAATPAQPSSHVSVYALRGASALLPVGLAQALAHNLAAALLLGWLARWA